MKSVGITSRSWFLSFKPFRINGIDLLFLITVIGLVIFGLIMVYSSSYIFAQERTGDGFAFIKKQLIFSGLGVLAFFGGFSIDYRLLKKYAYWILGLATVLLILVWIPGIGTKVGGAQRWIRVGPINFQPGEFAKLAIILFSCYQLNKKESRLHSFAAGVISPILLALPALALLLMQPDFGTTVLILMVIFSLWFISGVPKKYLIGMSVLGVIGACVLIWSSDYRRERLLGFLNPWQDPGGKGFQILQSLLGVHNGNLWGVGLGNGKEKLFYLPEAHNDFIFSVVGEELGFLGIFAVICAYLVLVYRGLKMAWLAQIRHKDTFAMLFVAGLTMLLGFQAFINMAVVLGALPTKGLPLPFVSYGGSALMVHLFAVGLILNIGRSSRAT